MHPVVLLSMANHLSRTGNMGNRMGAARLLTDLGRAGHVFLDHDYLGTSTVQELSWKYFALTWKSNYSPLFEMTTPTTGSTLQLAPLRTVNDFLLESARFQLPNFQDLEKVNNRIVKNLLYYQTNYFLMGAAVFGLIGLIHPYKVVLGVAILLALAYVFIKFFAAEARRSISVTSGHQQPNKWAVLGGVLGCSYLVLFLFDAVLIVTVCRAAANFVVMAFVHASLRLRNMKNKITNAIEVVGVKQSPMGQFLEAMGLMPDAF
ncbi:hypothetical protein pipiens_018699 [Culex pipiens pipiens]|uniref:PRA1 family protein n=1 Tax=Culex pipiens pipiens TaxID=38569 RepID=A0ABD1CAG3_CULPP